MCSKHNCSWLLLSIHTLQKLLIEVIIQDNFLLSTKEKKTTEEVHSLTTTTVQYEIHIFATRCIIMFACLYRIVGEESDFHIATALVTEKKLLLELNL